MRLLIVAAGSRGDVAPSVGLGAGLHRLGHQVTVATQQLFAPMVTEAGLQYSLMPGDMRAVLSSRSARGLQEHGTGLRGVIEITKLTRQLFADVGAGLVAAAPGADVLLLHRSAIVHGYLLGQAWGIPAVSLELFPGVPSREFGIPSLANRSLGTLGNRLVLGLLSRLPLPVFDAALADFARTLDIPPCRFGALRQQMLQDPNHLILHGYSPQIIPRPADWRPGIEVTGYWWPVTPPEWSPPPALTDFLAAGPPPVFIGFGSMLEGDSNRMSKIIHDAVRQAGVRAVVQAGWAGLAVNTDEVLTIGDAPHEWLFPRMAAVVHHCGAGTTGASLRAGVPVVPVPVLVDQPFWADRLARLRIATPALPAAKLTASALAAALRQITTDPAYAARAEIIGARVRAEDGVGAVAAAIARYA